MSRKDHLLVYDMPRRLASVKTAWSDFLSHATDSKVDTIEVHYEESAPHISSDRTILTSQPGELDRLQREVNEYDDVTLVSFNTPNVDICHQHLTRVFPDPAISKRYNNKLTQYELFDRLGIAVPRFTPTRTGDLHNFKPPFFYTLDRSAGGIGNGILATPHEIEAVRAQYGDDRDAIVADVVDDIVSKPCQVAICGEDGWSLMPLADQVTNGNAYLGNVYPSIHEGSSLERSIEDSTSLVAEELQKQGYRGMFGVDYLVTRSGEAWLTDLNARRVGAYALYATILGNDLMKAEFDAIRSPDPMPERLIPKFTPSELTGEYSHIAMVAVSRPTEVIGRSVSDPSPRDPRIVDDDASVLSIELFYPQGSAVDTMPATIGRSVIGSAGYEAALKATQSANEYVNNNMIA